MNNRYILKLRSLHHYVKNKLGYSAKPNVSLYDLAVKALELDGIYKNDTRNSKKFVQENAEFIMGKTTKKYIPYKPKKEISRSFVVKKTTINVEEKIITPPNLSYIHRQSSKVKITKPNYVASTSFLNSYEWRKLRMEALIKYGRKCVCCGATPDSGAVMNVDHIKPRKTHPELALDLNNLQILCSECNHGKGNWDNTDWR